MILEILRGSRDTAEAVAHEDEDPEEANMRVASLAYSSFSKPVSATQQTFEQRDAENKAQTCPVRYMNGSHGTVTFGPSCKPQYHDEYTRDILPRALTQEAMIHAMTYVNDKVWEITSMPEALQTENPPFVGGCWVTHNKGDLDNPKVRCRWVATELNTGDHMYFYAATPPLEGKRLLFNVFAHQRRVRGPKLQLSFSDITNACFNARPSRNLFVRVPKEMGLPPNTLGRLLRCCYGTRGAGAVLEDTYAQALVSMGFTRGKASPAVSTTAKEISLSLCMATTSRP